LPSRKYYDKAFGKNRWPKGVLISLGIGQGELSVTPVQLAQYAALFANYGKTAKPHFLKVMLKQKQESIFQYNRSILILELAAIRLILFAMQCTV
jgi:penicillin-binding protein 2